MTRLTRFLWFAAEGNLKEEETESLRGRTKIGEQLSLLGELDYEYTDESTDDTARAASTAD